MNKSIKSRIGQHLNCAKDSSAGVVYHRMTTQNRRDQNKMRFAKTS